MYKKQSARDVDHLLISGICYKTKLDKFWEKVRVK